MHVDGTLTMNDNSSISNNSAVSCNSNYSRHGGGVALLKDAKMTMDGRHSEQEHQYERRRRRHCGHLTSDLRVWLR